MDAAVIGGGVIGLAVAWRAARAGLSVAVVDPDPGSGASNFAAGMIAPIGEAEFGEEAVIALNRGSAARYPAFIAELELDAGRSAGYRQTGTLHVAVDADERMALERQFAFRRELGLPVERLTSRQTRDLEPGLSPSIRGGMLVESDHQVDPRAMVATLLQACSRLGVQIHRSRASLLVEAGRATGVGLDGGARVDASSVVLAAGCWSGSVKGVPDEDVPPVWPMKGQILRLRGAPNMIARTIRGGSVYIVPRGDGRVVIGGTVEERGFDTSVTAGAVYELLREARALVPDVAELELVESSAGLRPGSPDNMPMVGDATTPGLIIATGHYRNGYLLAPATADAVAGVLAGSAWPDATRPWSPSRFRRTAGVGA
ncbi:MAG TPA: glycine oxidase ThiO [Candidatus Saccharimonadales bacterium]|nr:glycine oxidase ThiO [Candidatus Saccharimonadales bacterium]